MYIFISLKNYNLFNFHPTFKRITNPLNNSVSKAITIIRQLGGKVYRVDQNSFAQISKLPTDAKIKFLESQLRFKTFNTYY